MSIESWKAEFYPIEARTLEASGASDKQLVAHSLKKWTGILPENLSKHNLYVKDCSLVRSDGSHGFFDIDASTCALCKRFWSWNNLRCKECPLDETVGISCIKKYGSPWFAWAISGDASEMVSALEKTLRRLEEEGNDVN